MTFLPIRALIDWIRIASTPTLSRRITPEMTPSDIALRISY